MEQTTTELPLANPPVSFGTRLVRYLTRFRPARLPVDGRERLRASIGVFVGIAMTGLLSRWWADVYHLGPWLVAPLGASAVLVFAVPASPLAQPWSVFGGNTLSALVGVAVAMVVPDPVWAGAIAVGVAIGVMFALRCVHPPGGASALFAALTAQSFSFAVFPILVNSILLIVAGVVYNSLTGRAYPHSQSLPATRAEGAVSRFSATDLDAALAHYNQVLDVSRDDLEALLHHAEANAYQRTFGQLRCKDVMTPNPVSAQFGASLADAWALMREHQIKALPITDRERRLVGIVTMADFMRNADLRSHDGIGRRLMNLVRKNGGAQSNRPEVVGQIMSREVRVASEERHVAELVPLFSHGGHHHIPVIDEEKRLKGIITQTDLVRSLYQAIYQTNA
ncbi:HPP family protein [Ottowia thiooxydans]|uniref:HPP family protein n=1 Tax=Ottowia thiooxydans TaxID=219182 RepID=UPI0004108BE7|nr:HPP family protein [Ottowia thiooxydans]